MGKKKRNSCTGRHPSVAPWTKQQIQKYRTSHCRCIKNRVIILLFCVAFHKNLRVFLFFLSCTCHFASAYTSKGQMFSFWSYYSPSRKTNCQDSGCKQLWAYCCAVTSADFQRECKKFKRQLINMPTKPRRNRVMNIHIVPETWYFERTCSSIRRRIHEHLLLK